MAAPTAGVRMAATQAQYLSSATSVLYLVSGWQRLLPADPRRWFVRFDAPSPAGGVLYVVPGGQTGITFVPGSPNVPFDLKYYDCPGIVTGEWWGYGQSPVIAVVWQDLYTGT